MTGYNDFDLDQVLVFFNGRFSCFFGSLLLSVAARRGFTIRLKRLKPKAPNFGGPENFGSKDNFQQFCKQYTVIFVLVQRTFLYYSANKRSQLKNELEGLK